MDHRAGSHRVTGALTRAGFPGFVMAPHAAEPGFHILIPAPFQDTLDTTLLTMSKAKVGKYQAFQLNQGVDISEFAGFQLNLNTLVTVEGADVFIVTNFSGTNDPVSTKTMLKLVNRTMKLR
jgi:hypothetical protein